jgi:hypothetical protein
MSDVKRYEPANAWGQTYMAALHSGGWVKHDDYAELETRLYGADNLRAALAQPDPRVAALVSALEDIAREPHGADGPNLHRCRMTARAALAAFDKGGKNE